MNALVDLSSQSTGLILQEGAVIVLHSDHGHFVQQQQQKQGALRRVRLLHYI